MKTDTSNQETSTQWVEIPAQLVDKLVGKNMAMIYIFDNLTIDLPKAHKDQAVYILSALSRLLTATVIIATEVTVLIHCRLTIAAISSVWPT
ncbi:MAG: hypothetical protein WAM14_23500 [Candidatus Nitrosopolaris sp.]